MIRPQTPDGVLVVVFRERGPEPVDEERVDPARLLRCAPLGSESRALPGLGEPANTGEAQGAVVPERSPLEGVLGEVSAEGQGARNVEGARCRGAPAVGEPEIDDAHWLGDARPRAPRGGEEGLFDLVSVYRDRNRIVGRRFVEGRARAEDVLIGAGVQDARGQGEQFEAPVLEDAGGRVKVLPGGASRAEGEVPIDDDARLGGSESRCEGVQQFFLRVAVRADVVNDESISAYGASLEPRPVLDPSRVPGAIPCVDRVRALENGGDAGPRPHRELLGADPELEKAFGVEELGGQAQALRLGGGPRGGDRVLGIGDFPVRGSGSDELGEGGAFRADAQHLGEVEEGRAEKVDPRGILVPGDVVEDGGEVVFLFVGARSVSAVAHGPAQ